MGKKKTIIVHSIKDYPKDLEILFDTLVVVMENNEILVTDAYSFGRLAIVEVGPRENLSSNFGFGKRELNIGFQVKDNILDIIYIGPPRTGKFLKHEIIKCFNKAVRLMDQTTVKVYDQSGNQSTNNNNNNNSNTNNSTTDDGNKTPGYFDGEGQHTLYTKGGRVDCDGWFHKGKLVNGKKYFYTADGKLERIAVYKEGKIFDIQYQE